MIRSKSNELAFHSCNNGLYSNVSIEEIKKFWDEYVYDDVKVSSNPLGSREFFCELENIRYQRLDYLSRLINFPSFRGKKVLEIGCRIGLDLARFAENGALVTGIELSESCIDIAHQYFAKKALKSDFYVMDGENMSFSDDCFDVVYAHGVVQYTANPQRMVDEIYRVLRKDGIAIIMVYNRYSWLNILSKLSGKKLTHEEAPAFEPYSIKQFYSLLNKFSKVEIFPERFPVRTTLHKGLIANMYYTFFVGTFKMLPSSWIKRFGAHLVAKAKR